MLQAVLRRGTPESRVSRTGNEVRLEQEKKDRAGVVGTWHRQRVINRPDSIPRKQIAESDERQILKESKEGSENIVRETLPQTSICRERGVDDTTPRIPFFFDVSRLDELHLFGQAGTDELLLCSPP